MPRQQTVTEVRLDNISTCVTITVNTLDVLVNTLKIHGLEAMVNTTQSLLKLGDFTAATYISYHSQHLNPSLNNAPGKLVTRRRRRRRRSSSITAEEDLLASKSQSWQQLWGSLPKQQYISQKNTIKQDKNECAELMEQTHNILNAIIGVYVKSDTGIELPPSTLNEIANFTQTLHKIYTFIEAQQGGSKVKKFFRKGELGGLLKDCKTGLQEGIKFFQANTLHIDLTQAVLYHLSEGSPTLLILDNLETVWEPAESRKEVEEFLSLLTDITSLVLMPLAQEAARKVFIAITEDRHPMEEIDQVLSLTDNMPLSINLLAHAVDVEGATAILSRWQREHTSVISEGYDRKSNLESSILLSLESPRITSTPHSQELLSLLSILPDGLSDVELKQSKFAIQDILDCKRALLHTALAYLDDHKRLKALVPIREYMAKFRPPTDEMIGPLFKHFQELLQVYAADRWKQSSALYVERLTSNYTNIQNIIQNGLYPGHPNLSDSISCTSHFLLFNINAVKGATPLVNKALALLPHSEDHGVKASFTIRLFGTNKTLSIPHPEALMAQTLEWLKTLDDPDLEATFYTNLSHHYLELDIPAALKYCQMGLSLAKSHGNIRGQSTALAQLSWIKWFTGDYITAQANAQEAQRVAKKSGNLHREASGLYTEALCCQMLGDYRECIFLVRKASALLELCGLSQGDLNYHLMTCQAEVHEHKSEYADVHNLWGQLLQTYQGGRLYYEGFSLVNIAGAEVPMGVSCEVIQEKIYASQTIFNKIGNKVRFLRSAKEKLRIYKALQFIGDVHLMQNDEVSAVSLFTVALGGFTYMDVHRSRAECMTQLGDIAKKNGDLLKALELWETAKPLFERSSQAKRVQDIDERVGSISEETKEQHRKNLARLAELNVPAGKVEEVGSEELGLEEEQVKLIAV
ncbi:hypothetical protein B0H16DRAFT_1706483 [Mycena metata]|uniref:Uncharacterized protein n=1 Tax=Mycena metata TaxID=1033252 RepID=A0AAD7DQ61_9AGAR|nr:hypothetical protein B0H16DRAFT_1706483 [Mycena metata]